MAFSAEQRAFLNEDYTAVTGKPVRRFVCPITLKDEPEGELCDGHILNASIQTASRKTVVEYKDVDNYFGTTIEPDLVAFLNAPVSTPRELIEKYGRTLTVTLPSGEKASAFFANRKARPNFPRIDLLDTSGVAIASPYLRTGPLEPKLHKNLQVEWLMGFTNSAIFGSLLKSAHLALFRIMGYRHVLSPAGSYLRQSLASFYIDKADKAQSSRYFSKFAGAVKPVLNDIPADVGGTLEDGSLWFHYEPGGLDKHLLFAISCLFKVNGRLVTVMVPYCMDGNQFEVTCARYEAALKDSATPQDIHAAWFEDGKIQVNPHPLSVRRDTAPGGSSGGVEAQGPPVVQGSPVVMEEVTDPVQIAEAKARRERFDRNLAWLQAHTDEAYAHLGKCICIAAQELFVADTAEEVLAQAKAAHPEDDGRFTLYVPRERMARIYAHRRHVAPLS